MRTKNKTIRSMQTTIKTTRIKRKRIKTKRKNLGPWEQEFKSLGTRGRLLK
jgi:hypothetical protein